MNEKLKLKPCPFCGGRATVVEQGTGISCAWVECGQCGTRTRTLFGENKVDRVVAAWNRRMPWMLQNENEEIEKRIPRWEENKMPHIKGEIRPPEA